MKQKSDMERTSADIAHIAGQLLTGRSVKDAHAWLVDVADAPETTSEVRGHATMLLGALDAMRRLAGSALTQR